MRVEVVDLGMVAGPPPCTFACLWLSMAAGLAALDPALVPDVALRSLVSPLLASLSAVAPGDLQKG